MNEIKKELTPELKARLKSYRAIKPSSELQFTPEIFKEIYEEEKWPVFTVKTSTTVDTLTSEFSTIGGYKLAMFKNNVKNWTNPSNVLGADFKKEYLLNNKLTNEAICLFSPELVCEVADFIVLNSGLTEDESLSL